ncbi:MAG TPA: M4 family metallopeptidase, partial [Chitinophagales bacterium]|nr:M4 family metallopeptidase [Chitinophagales bacterium]
MDTAQIKSVMGYFNRHPVINAPDNFDIRGGWDDFRIKWSYEKGWLKSDTIDKTLNIAYTFILSIHGKEYYVYIDAHSGLVKQTRDYLTRASVGVMACETGNVHTQYGGYGGFTPLPIQTYDVDDNYRVIYNIQNEENYVLETDETCLYSGIQLRLFDEFLSPPANGTSIVNPSNNWIDNVTFNSYATMFWAIEQIYDYYQTKHGLTGWYDNGINAQKNIKIGVAYTTAAPVPFLGWSPHTTGNDGQPIIRVANANNTLTPIYDDWGNLIQSATVWGNLASIDLLAHEYTHAIDYYYGENLFAWTPPDGLSDLEYLLKVNRCRRFLESVCDIMGASIEHSIKGSYDWLFMHHLTNGKKLQRSFKRPNNYSYHIAEDCAGATKTYLDGQPSYYNQPGFYDSGACEDDPYVNGGVMNHWFYLLAKGNMPNGTTINGNTHYVEPIGNVGQDSVAKAMDIVYQVFLNKNSPTNIKFNPDLDDYPQVCAKTLLAAHALYPPTASGECSPELQ